MKIKEIIKPPKNGRSGADHRGGKPIKLTDQQIIEDYKKGLFIHQIKKKGVGTARIRRVIRGAGLC